MEKGFLGLCLSVPQACCPAAVLEISSSLILSIPTLSHLQSTSYRLDFMPSFFLFTLILKKQVVPWPIENGDLRGKWVEIFQVRKYLYCVLWFDCALIQNRVQPWKSFSLRMLKAAVQLEHGPCCCREVRWGLIPILNPCHESSFFFSAKLLRFFLHLWLQMSLDVGFS